MGGPKCNYENLKQKNGFLTWPNMALTNMGLKTKIGLILGRRTKREEGEKRGEEKRKRRRREEEEEGGVKQKGIELHGLLKL